MHVSINVSYKLPDYIFFVNQLQEHNIAFGYQPQAQPSTHIQIVLPGPIQSTVPNQQFVIGTPPSQQPILLQV